MHSGEAADAFRDQLEHSGFAILNGVFGSEETDLLLNELNQEELPHSRAGIRHALTIPEIARVASESRLLDLARGALGSRATPFRATLFDKSPGSNWLVVWHQDTALPLREKRETAGWGPWSVKQGIVYAHAPAAALQTVLALRIHLDESTADKGPLRVLPGTHKLGVLTDDFVHDLARKVSSTDCLVSKGGVLAMNPLIVHASSKSENAANRRVLHIEYAASLTVGQGLELAIA